MPLTPVHELIISYLPPRKTDTMKATSPAQPMMKMRAMMMPAYQSGFSLPLTAGAPAQGG